MELVKVTKEIAVRAILCGACSIPEVGRLISSFSVSDLLWAEKMFTPIELKEFKQPLWTLSGCAYGNGSGYGYGDGDGSGGCAYGYGYGCAYGNSYFAGYGYGYGLYGDGYCDGYGYGGCAYGNGYGDGSGYGVYGDGYGYGCVDGGGDGRGLDVGAKILALEVA